MVVAIYNSVKLMLMFTALVCPLTLLVGINDAPAITFAGGVEVSDEKLKAMKKADQLSAWRKSGAWLAVVEILQKTRSEVKDTDIANLYFSLELTEIYLNELHDFDGAKQELRNAEKLLLRFPRDRESKHTHFPRYTKTYKAKYFEYFEQYRNINRSEIEDRLSMAKANMATILEAVQANFEPSNNPTKKLRLAIRQFENQLDTNMSDLDRAKILARLALFNFRLRKNSIGMNWGEKLELFLGTRVAQSDYQAEILQPLMMVEVSVGMGDSLAKIDNHREAVNYYRDSIEIFERFRVSASEQKSRVSLFTNLDKLYSKLIDSIYASNDKWALLAAVEKTKSRTFIEALQKNKSESDRFKKYRPMDFAQTKIEILKNKGENIDTGIALLNYYISDEFIIFISLTKNSIHVSRERIQKVEVTSLIRGLYESVDGLVFLKKDPSNLHKLSQILLSKLPINFDSVDQLVVIPHGALHSLPFEALKYKGSYLLELASVSYVPSLGVYEKFLKRSYSKTDLDLLAYGNPKYPIQLKNLLGAEIEATKVSNILISSNVQLSYNATEAHLRKNSSNASIVHLATHGKFIKDRPMDSLVYLAAGRGHDGLVTAAEMGKMNFNSTKLIVMSACETSVEQVLAGDDLFGFTRALGEGGVGSIVSAQWNISDSSTLFLMTQFYKAIRDGLYFSKALRYAKLETMKRYPSPYHWASFRFIGNHKLML